MFNQTITISKAGSNWATAQDADAAIRAVAGSDTVTFYENSKVNDNLISITVDLTNPDTLVYSRTWTEAGWTAMSSRQGEFNSVKSALEGQGYTISVDQPAYI